ncbi:MAG TPA: hypothetical protein VNQ73_14690 [Ilumatobacter sp.]|nr:hypothetical protein [Ilumatobacter sp.]
MNTTRHPSRRVAAAVAAGTLLFTGGLAACSDDDGDPNDIDNPVDGVDDMIDDNFDDDLNDDLTP